MDTCMFLYRTRYKDYLECVFRDSSYVALYFLCYLHCH